MPRYVALLRGVAPSLPNMTNDRLRAAVATLGVQDVGSVLASGNILFTSEDEDRARLERRVEEALTAELGLSCRALVRSAADLRALVDADPFPGLTHSRDTYLLVTFARRAVPEDVPAQPDPATRVVGFDAPARALLAVTDNTAPGRTTAYMGWVEQLLGTEVTTRSWLSVLRILRRLEG